MQSNPPSSKQPAPSFRAGRAGLLALWLAALGCGPAVFAQDKNATNAPITVDAAGEEQHGKKWDKELHIAPPRFESWPAPPGKGTAVIEPAPTVMVVPEVMPKDVQDQNLYSFHAENLELKLALAMFGRANHLNIVPDPDITGQVTLDVTDLPLKKILQAMLETHDVTWAKDDGLIRVHATETRMFKVDYLRMIRNGIGHSSATLSSGSSGGGAGGGGGGGGGAGGGSGISVSSSDIKLDQQNPVDFWKDLQENLDKLLTPAGKDSLAINKTAGIVQITDRPSALKRVDEFLKDVGTSSLRQVEIEAKLYVVTLNKSFQFGIDWVQLAEASGGMLGLGALTGPQAIGGTALGQNAIGGLTTLGLGPTNLSSTTGNPLVYNGQHTQVAVNALQQQGSVEVIAQPRIRTLNNQTALIKVGTDQPFFAQTLQSTYVNGGNQTVSGEIVTTITVGTILSITPQISDDGWITLDVSPVLTSLTGTVTSPDELATAPILDTKQASALVRIRDGATVILGGLIQTEHAKNQTKVPVLGDIPYLGKLFTGTFDAKTKTELVIFLTPTIVR